MTERLSAFFTLTVGFGLNLASRVLMDPYHFGFCRKVFIFGERPTCLDNISFAVGKPLKIYAFGLIASGLLLLFLHNKEVRSWLWFAIPWSAFTFFAVYNVPTIDHSLYAIQKDTVSIGLAGIFVLVSLALVIYKLFKRRKGRFETLNTPNTHNTPDTLN